MIEKKEDSTQLENVLKVVKEKKAKQFYFVACGGSMATLEAAKYIFDRETEIPSHIYNSKEFMTRSPKALGKDSVVILCSHSGKTPETAEAATFAIEKGALTVAISNGIDSPLSKSAEHVIHYKWGDKVDASEGLSGTLYQIVFGILDIYTEDDKFKKAILAINNLQNCIELSKEKFSQAALTFGKEYRRESLMYTIASGGLYPEAYALTACFLMEMQWINSGSIHSGEYFHGPFEITDYDVPFMMLKSIGEARVMDDRAHKFLKNNSSKLTVIDAKEFNMEGLEEEFKPYFSHAIMTEVVKSYVEALADARGHMMSVRRYMGRMEY